MRTQQFYSLIQLNNKCSPKTTHTTFDKILASWINSFRKDGVIQFGKKLREIRLKKKLSQGDVSRILGGHRTYMSGLERGARNPSLLTVQKIVKALGISSKELL